MMDHIKFAATMGKAAAGGDIQSILQKYPWLLSSLIGGGVGGLGGLGVGMMGEKKRPLTGLLAGAGLGAAAGGLGHSMFAGSSPGQAKDGPPPEGAANTRRPMVGPGMHMPTNLETTQDRPEYGQISRPRRPLGEASNAKGPGTGTPGSAR